MNRSLTIVLAIALACCGMRTVVAADESTWSAPPAFAQLQRDPALIPKGKGLLFVPAMTLPIGNEPSYQVFRDGDRITSASPGRSIPLDPGTYEIHLGSGNISQLIRKTVPAFEGESTMLKADWAALVIDVIDRTRTSVNESYELFDAGGESYGPGSGIEEERGERVRTWILKPGVYNVVRLGESFATIDKFSVRLLPGSMTQRNLVFDSDTGEFTAFYQSPLLQSGTARAASAVTSQTELSGSVQLNTSQRTAGEDLTSLNMVVQAFNRTRYNTIHDYANIRVIIEEGATKEEGQRLRKGIDNAEVRATYIYRLSRRIGPYLRGVVATNMFPEEVNFRVPQDSLVRISANGHTDTLTNVNNFTLAPSFSPISLREGIGINSQLFRTFALNMDVRLGIGARQDLTSDSFKLSNDRRSVSELETTTSTGLEALLILDARLARFVNLDSEFDILISSRDTQEWFFTWENRLRFALTSFINLDIVADIEREQILRRLQGREQFLLRFSRFF